MPRYIDADLIDYNEICVPMLDGMIVRTKKLDGLYAQQKYIEKIPTADVQEVKHGEWIEDRYENAACVCSCCGAEPQYVSKFNETFDYDWEENLQHTGYEEIREYIKTPYCSQCGAKMDAKE